MEKEYFDFVIVGAGFAGSVMAERLSSEGKKVLVIEKRRTLGGNCADYFNIDKNYIQIFGPHIFHTNIEEVWSYLSKFTTWMDYRHKVLSLVDGKEIPVPFNLHSLEALYGEKSKMYKDKLIKEFGMGSRVSIFALLENKNLDLKNLGKLIYKKIFYGYSKKQWGKESNKLDKSVLERVPVNISYENNYFGDKYQSMPSKGFTKIIEKMLKNSEIILNTDYKKILPNLNYKVLIITSPIDAFFDYRFGKIKYRKAYFLQEKKLFPSQDNSVINYPSTKIKFTRVTECNHFYGIKNKESYIVKEFPSWKKGENAWPIQTAENLSIIEKYTTEAKNLMNVFFIGRLAEGKYFNIDQTIKSALDLYKKIQD